MNKIPVIPGRGLLQPSAIQARKDFIQAEGYHIDSIALHRLMISEIQNNIESFIGSVEIPLGLVGPLLFKSPNNEELVYCVAGTLEGALISSMNRGARALSLSGGFDASVKHQRMLRAPTFIFSKEEFAKRFENWVKTNFNLIKQEAELHSNHAKLLKIDHTTLGTITHLKFVYTTGDASGQNMTTTCTWQAVLWIAKQFQSETEVPIERFIIEGNAASDKKISEYTVREGRGINVTARALLREEIIHRVLRTSSEEFLAYFSTSREITARDGMIGYNINVANAIAAIFVATGQDLASIHESAYGVFNIEKHPEGLVISLNLTNLVIGSIGGGTHLKKQKEALELMNCYGNNKVERFASLIAGFALGLEVSTYAAIVSGAFSKAHEKLGRNKPVQWLTRSEISIDFIKKWIQDSHIANELEKVEPESEQIVENGIITHITNKVSKKLIGFLPITVTLSGKQEKLVLKSKALDIDVINGLHLLAAVIDTELADLIFKYREKLEYWQCHQKEIALYESLSKNNFMCIPKYWGKHVNDSRECYVFLMEYLDPTELVLINSQKNPELWKTEQIETVIQNITGIHQFYLKEGNRKDLPMVNNFMPWKQRELYEKFIAIMIAESEGSDKADLVGQLNRFLNDLESEKSLLKIERTLIHNDFNSRNIAIRKDHDLMGNSIPVIYDWELAVLDIPHRDIVEFLSFVLVENFTEADLYHHLQFHYTLYKSDLTISEEEWYQGYIYAIKEYLVTRVSFYEVAGIQAKYAFSERILKNSFRMLEVLE